MSITKLQNILELRNFPFFQPLAYFESKLQTAYQTATVFHAIQHRYRSYLANTTYLIYTVDYSSSNTVNAW